MDTTRHGSTPVGDNLAAAVDIGEKCLQGQNALPDAPHDQVPFGGVDDPGDQVERERAFLALVVESHPAVGEDAGQLVRAEAQLAGVERLQRGKQRRVRGTWLAGTLKHLVPRVGEPVTVENVRHDRSVRALCSVVINHDDECVSAMFRGRSSGAAGWPEPSAGASPAGVATEVTWRKM